MPWVGPLYDLIQFRPMNQWAYPRPRNVAITLGIWEEGSGGPDHDTIWSLLFQVLICGRHLTPRLFLQFC